MAPDPSPINRTPVLIIGGGPVGRGLAVELGWRGVACVLVEQGDGAIELPRANTIDLRTMEYCRRWGVADKVRRAGLPRDWSHTALYATSMTGFEIARFDRPDHGGDRPMDISPERQQRCNQLFFDPILRELAGGMASVTLRYRTRFDSFAEDEGGVTARVADLESGKAETIRAQYLVACCGGRSPVRAGLGIALGDGSALGYPMSIFFRAANMWSHHDKGRTALNFIVGPEGVWATLIPVDGVELWRITVHGGKDQIDPAAVDADAIIRRVVGAGIDFELIRMGGWVRRDMVAMRYRYGNVFLAGDCAHQNTPTGGYGMNTGMGDAVDLGWKLAATLDGWGGPGLLDSYQAERRPVARRNVTEATGNFQRRRTLPGAAVTEESEEGARVRRELGQRITAEATRQHRGHGIALGHLYDASPVIAPEPDQAPDLVTDYVATARAGARAPHAGLADGRSTLDLFGRGFVLLRLGAAPPGVAALEAATGARGVPLEVVHIMDEDIHRLYEKQLVLVRPGGIVAWRGDVPPDDAGALMDLVRGAGDAR